MACAPPVLTWKNSAASKRKVSSAHLLGQDAVAPEGDRRPVGLGQHDVEPVGLGGHVERGVGGRVQDGGRGAAGRVGTQLDLGRVGVVADHVADPLGRRRQDQAVVDRHDVVAAGPVEPESAVVGRVHLRVGAVPGVGADGAAWFDGRVDEAAGAVASCSTTTRCLRRRWASGPTCCRSQPPHSGT